MEYALQCATGTYAYTHDIFSVIYGLSKEAVIRTNSLISVKSKRELLVINWKQRER